MFSPTLCQTQKPVLAASNANKSFLAIKASGQEALFAKRVFKQAAV